MFDNFKRHGGTPDYRGDIHVPTPELEHFDVEESEIPRWEAQLRLPPEPIGVSDTPQPLFLQTSEAATVMGKINKTRTVREASAAKGIEGFLNHKTWFKFQRR